MATKKPLPSPAPKATASRVGQLAKVPTKPSPVKTLPSLAEYKQSAAYKSGAMSYKEYLDYFKSRGYK